MMQNLRENETNEMYFCHTRSTEVQSSSSSSPSLLHKIRKGVASRCEHCCFYNVLCLQTKPYYGQQRDRAKCLRYRVVFVHVLQSQTLYEDCHFLRRNCTKFCVSIGPRKLSMIEICPYYRGRDNCMKFCISGTHNTVHNSQRCVRIKRTVCD